MVDVIRVLTGLAVLSFAVCTVPARGQTGHTQLRLGAGVARSIYHPHRIMYGGQVYNVGLTFPRRPIDVRAELARFSGGIVCTLTCGGESWRPIGSLMVGSHWSEGNGAVRSELGGAAGLMADYSVGPAFRTYFAVVIPLGRIAEVRLEGAYAIGFSLRRLGSRGGRSGDGLDALDYLSLHIGLSNHT